MKNKKRKKRLLRHFFEGLVALLPLALTGVIIYWLGNFVHRTLNIFPEKAFRLIFPGKEMVGFWVPVYWIAFYLLIVLLFFLFTALIGFILRWSLGRKLFGIWEGLLAKIPLVKNFYSPLKQVFSSLLGGGENRFKRVVIVEYPRKGLYSVGFVTSEISGETGKKLLTLFIPSSPNPTTGWMLIVAEDEVVDSSMSIEQGVKLIFSGGLASGNIRSLEDLAEKINQ
jgi:uncharacterized membrane protein